MRLGDYGHNGNAGDRWGWGMMYDTLGRESDLKADYQRWTDAVLGAVAVEEGRIALNGRVVSTGRFFVSELDGYIRILPIQGGTVIIVR